jgi:hypothetical protein
MGWLKNLFAKVEGASATDWTFFDDLADPGLGIAGKPVVPDECYVELYVESLRLEKARKFATVFHGVIYSFASLARSGNNRSELASVTKPQNLASLDATNMDRVITVSKRIMSAMPWRGDPLGLEVGLFSVKSGNLLTPLIDFVTKVSDNAGITTLTQLNPLLPLISEGLDLIAGQKDSTELELALDTDLSLAESRLCALIAVPKGQIAASDLTIDRLDRKLLHKGEPLKAAYCVISIRTTDRNADWGRIPALQASFAQFNQALIAGKRADAEEALAAFNRQVIVTPDLIDIDKARLKTKAKENLHEAFPGGGQSAKAGELERRFEGRSLESLALYDN